MHSKACDVNVACVKVCARIKWDRLNGGSAVRALLWGSAGSRVRPACLSVIKAVVMEAASDRGKVSPHGEAAKHPWTHKYTCHGVWVFVPPKTGVLLRGCLSWSCRSAGIQGETLWKIPD